MRTYFTTQLNELKNNLLEMAALCESSIEKVIQALKTGDITLMRALKKEAPEIDRLERTIESLCMRLLLHQQPVAHDLHLISASLKIITDMERIGDQTEAIADNLLLLQGKKSPLTPLVETMATKTLQMLSESINAFIENKLDLARKVIESDDLIDNYFSEVKYDIISLIERNEGEGEVALDFLMIAKYFERIADHATNIAEWVIYALTGHHEEESP